MLKIKNQFYYLLLFLIIFCVSELTFGQKPVKCKTEVKHPKFKMVILDYGAPSTKTLLGKALIKPSDVNDENLIALANFFKQTYCQENSMIIQIFDNKRATQLNPLEYLVEATPRATYLLDREKGEEILKTYMVKEGKQIGTEIKLPN